jgi:hypothetical protein
VSVAARRKSPSKVDLQAVLRHLDKSDGVGSAALVAWIVQTFQCRERAAKDNLAVLARGGWTDKDREASDRRRVLYTLTEKGRADASGGFGRAALRRGRRLYSTCLSGKARERQAARREAADNPLARTLEAEARHLYGGPEAEGLIRELMADVRLQTAARYHRRSPFRARVRKQLLSEREPV